MKGSNPIIYLAGPGCAPEEREFLKTVAGELARCNYVSYIPWQDGLEGYFHHLSLSVDAGTGITALAQASFALEMYQISFRCHALIFNMNGRVPDEGAVFKAASAFAAGKPVVIYKRDHRTAFYGVDNSMVSGLSHTFTTVKTLARLPKALNKALAKLPPVQGSNQKPTSLQYSSTIRLGRELWELLQSRHKHTPWEYDKTELVKKVIHKVTTCTG